MVQVSVEVRSGSARFWVSVRAQSVQQAASIVAGRYPGMDVKVKFPIDPKDFFVEDSVVRMGRSALGPILGPPYTCPGDSCVLCSSACDEHGTAKTIWHDVHAY